MQEKMRSLKEGRVKKPNKRQCCVPQCESKSRTSLHRFPTSTSSRKQWLRALKMENLAANINGNMVVCGSHFREDDFVPRERVKRRTLKRIAVPSVYLPMNLPVNLLPNLPDVRPTDKDLISITREKQRQEGELQKKIDERQEPRKKSHENTGRYFPSTQQEQELMETLDMSSINIEGSESECLNEAPHIQQQALVGLEDIVVDNTQVCENREYKDDDEIEVVDSCKTACETGELLILLAKQKYITKISVTEKGYKRTDSETRKSILMELLNSENVETICGIDFILLNNLQKAVKLYEPMSNEYSTEERVVLCLCKLKLNPSFRCLSVLFAMDVKTCSTIFLTTLHTLALILKDAIYWPPKGEILKTMPEYGLNNGTYVFLDCIEIPVERPECSQCRIQLYSPYKGHETIKLLVCTFPSGLIIFISDVYGGHTSEKAIVDLSKILNKLEPNQDTITARHKFTINRECARMQIKLITHSNVVETVNNKRKTFDITSARAHADKTIEKMKLFNILTSKISLKIVPYMNEVCTIIGGLVNIRSPFISKKIL